MDGNVNDSSGNNLNGVWHGTARYAAGHTGQPGDQAIDVSSTITNYVTVAHNDLLGGIEKPTISVWARKNNPDQGGEIVSKYLQYRITIGDRSMSSYVGNQYGTLGRANNYNVSAIHDSNWHHYLLAYDGSSVMLSVDGVLQATAPLTGTVASVSGRDLYIGRDPWGPSFDGQIDELIICGPQQTIQDGYHPPTLTGAITQTRLADPHIVVLPPCSANIVHLQESPVLTLRGAPANHAIRLDWTVTGILPITSTWTISYAGPTGDQPSPITGILSPTRAYTLTGLTNYTWYTVTLNAMLESTPFLSDTVRVMPTDIFVYLPLVLK